MAAALAHNIPIIPVLVQRAAMVLPADLPADMAGLANGRPIELTQAHWGSDVETLLDYLESHNLAPMKSEAGPDSVPATAQARRNRGATIPGALASSNGHNGPNGRAALREPARSGGPWRWMLAAALVVAVAVGAYITMAGRDKPAAVEPTVSDALGAAQTAVARAEAARDEAEAARVAAETAARSVAPPASAAPSSVPPVAREPSAADKAKAEREAAATKAAEQEAQMRKAAKEEAEQAARLAREAKQKAAAAEAAKPVAPPKAAPDKPALAATPEPPAPDVAGAGAKSYSMKWTLRSSACGPTPVTVTGTARFTIEKTAEGIVVTENFRGSGGGVEAVTTGRAVFSKEQPSYDIPTTVEWSGARNFRSTGVDRVNASNGTQPTGARLVKLQSVCG